MGVHERFADEFAAIWERLGIPDKPFGALRLSALRRRPLRLVHADVHRKNVLVEATGRCVFIDWELALPGDPVYELAVHIHKMSYKPDEQETLTRLWAARCEQGRWPGWEEDLDIYLAHERVKSAIVDSVRYSQLVAAEPEKLMPCSASLQAKLAKAHAVWRRQAPTLETVTAVLTQADNLHQ